jgi:hypothetical protein
MSMVKRVLLFKIKEDTPADEVDQLLDVLATYPTRLPGVLNWSLGKNFSRDTSFDYALVCDFVSRDNLDAYMTHPYHRETAAQYFSPIVERLASIYYEYEPSDSLSDSQRSRVSGAPTSAPGTVQQGAALAAGEGI